MYGCSHPAGMSPAVLIAWCLVIVCHGPVFSADAERDSAWSLLGNSKRIVERGSNFILVQFSGGVAEQVPEPAIGGRRTRGIGEPAEGEEFKLTSYPSSTTPAPAAQAVTSENISSLPAADLGQVFAESEQLQTVQIRRRSPLTYHPYIRGYQGGQIYSQADGAWWLSARRDLDTLITQFDTALIQEVEVIPGPYGVRYGPGLSFINVTTFPTPRYQNGPEVHARLGLTPKTNGGQLYGRTTVFGGDCDSGYIFHYGTRSGSDYRSGDGTKIPASYQAQNFLGQYGIDIGPDSNIEFRYQRLDETDVEFAGLFFDLNYLGTDAFSVNFVDERPDASYTRFRLDAWYNTTRFTGDTNNASKRSFHVIDRVEDALEDAFGSQNVDFSGDTDGSLYSIGGRAVATYGDDDWTQLSLGADIRYAKRRIMEFYDIVDHDDSANSSKFYTNLPRADLIDPGLFAELSLPWHEYCTTTVGARLDWVHADARASELRPNSSLAGAPDDLTQNDVLYAFYLVNNVDLSSHWKTRFGFGQAQRFPTLTERYADGVFLGIIQSGFSRVIGDPNLDKERAWQIDLSLTADYCSWRGRVSAYHAWVVDYITYSANVVTDPEGARLLLATNTDLATLAGFEAYGEYDLSTRLTAFGSLQYINGRDQQLHAPLPAISPLEGRAGLRLHDPCRGETWGIDFGMRFVNDQNRLGTLRQVAPLTGSVPVEVRTPGFTTAYLRGYYNVNKRLNFIGGFENLFDKNYLEHLDLRLPADPRHNIPASLVLSPGFSPYVGVEWTY